LLDVLNTNEGYKIILKTHDGLIIKPGVLLFKDKAFINLVTKENRILNMYEIISQVTSILKVLKGFVFNEIIFNYPQKTEALSNAEVLLKKAFTKLEISFINEKKHVHYFDSHDL